MILICRAYDTGFTLAEIHELLNLRDSPCGCSQVQVLIDHRTKEVERQLSRLRAMRRALAECKRQCDQLNHADNCPLLQDLDTDGVHLTAEKPLSHQKKKKESTR